MKKKTADDWKLEALALRKWKARHEPELLIKMKRLEEFHQLQSENDLLYKAHAKLLEEFELLQIKYATEKAINSNMDQEWIAKVNAAYTKGAKEGARNKVLQAKIQSEEE